MKNVLLTLSFVFLLLQLSILNAQNTQTIKGKIIDQQSETPLIGATIEWVNPTETVGTVTDIDGYFRLENIPLGRHEFRISYIGYEPLTIPNIVVSAGKEVIMDVALRESVELLDAVVVTGSVEKDKPQNELATISARQFSVEEVNRYSGGRSDVARLASNFAGVSTANDSRNDIVIRGNSPTGVLWRMEGIPIPNPNHFSTLGTTGGPVSALNPNLIKNSDFLTSAFPAEYGNATAGVFDIGLRSGNRDKHEFMLQVGAFSGVEAMAEGPLSKKGGSYIFAGRYAFISLVGGLGGSGTSAVPNYYDLAFKINSATTKLGQFTLFGIGGLSNIDFLHDEVDETDLFAAADEDAFADSKFGVIGLKHNILLNEKTYWRTVVARTTSVNTFEQLRYFNEGTNEEFTASYGEADNTESRWSASSYINKKFNNKFTGRVGILAELYDYQLFSTDAEIGMDTDNDGVNELVTLIDFNDNVTLLQPFVQGQYRLNNKWTLNAGLHAQYLTFNETSAIEPRLALNWDFAAQQRLSFGYGVHHQMQPIPILLGVTEDENGNVVRSNENLDFTRSQHFVLGYDYKFAPDWRLKAEAYYQSIDGVPVDPFPSSFSILNTGDDFIFPREKDYLVNEGSGNNYGLELTLEKFFSRGYYGLLTASLYDSNYKGSDGIERNTAFNNTYVLNVLAGREWKVGKDKRNALTFDTKMTTAGGRRYTPVDLEVSQQLGYEIKMEDLAYSERNDPYFRWDVKFGYRFNSPKRKISHHFYLDIQNVLDKENIFVRRYNRQTNQVNEVNQIGFFPDFMYRVQF
ncbi:MAG: carboxypeptidase-like regulatory domain-containing protein [Chitinophagales bacterium]